MFCASRRRCFAPVIPGPEGHAPKGVTELSPGFQPGFNPGATIAERRTLKGRQIESTNDAAGGPMDAKFICPSCRPCRPSRLF
jgi:hypothetical protein